MRVIFQDDDYTLLMILAGVDTLESRPDQLTERFFDALRQLSGTHYRKLFSVVTLLQFLSLG